MSNRKVQRTLPVQGGSRVVVYEQLASMGIIYSRVHIDRLERAGKFPRHINLSVNRIAWAMPEIESWLAGRVAERDAKVLKQRGMVRRTTRNALPT